MDLTGDDSPDEQPALKKKKLNGRSVKNEPIFSPDLSNPLHDGCSSPIRQNGNGSRMQTPKTPNASISKYKFGQASGEPEVPETPEEKRDKKTRREAFKRRLLAEKNLFGKRPEVAPPTKPPRVSEDVMDVDDLENIKERKGEESEMEGSDRETSPLPAFITSKAFSSSKTKGKENVQKFSTKASKKVEEEIGPSGQTYTPLEKQASLRAQRLLLVHF